MITEVISYYDVGISREAIIGQTPESLIDNQVVAELCRRAIQKVVLTGKSFAMTLPITLPINPPKKINRYVHFKKCSKAPYVLAYIDNHDYINFEL